MVEEEEEPAAPAQHADTHPGRPEQPAVEEELVVSEGPEKNKRTRRNEATISNYSASTEPTLQQEEKMFAATS